MSTSSEICLDDLPGVEFAVTGLADLAAGRVSVGALLLEIAAARLRFAGMTLPNIPPHEIDPEFRLYRLLEAEHGEDAYAQYSAWLNRLGRFSRAVENRIWYNTLPLSS